jgi:hypothetical protein
MPRDFSTLDWPGLRAAAIALQNVQEVARQAARNLPPLEAKRLVQRIKKRAFRERWLDSEIITPVRSSTVLQETNQSSFPPQDPCTRHPPVGSSGAEILARTLKERKDQSALHLSKYVVDASKSLANSEGRLAYARDGRDLVAIRGNVWPETTQPGELSAEITLDDSGRVEALHARLRTLLGQGD